ncbi:PBD-domain-containing protein [Rickenella mellea]|uniref:PBD-domain-containing protein n=1 Tax=Rickenella mellea TaxID=50990 RepID=A0A4Y7Q4Q5_9AGAM|nr:PBD-domain-containing protein [Rickenella mellea]
MPHVYAKLERSSPRVRTPAPKLGETSLVPPEPRSPLDHSADSPAPLARSSANKGGNGLKNLFGLMSKRVKISIPTDPNHLHHVTVNQSTGEVNGLPNESQQRLQESGISKSEYEKNPQAVIDIVKFYKESEEENVLDIKARADDHPRQALPQPRKAPNASTVVTQLQPYLATPKPQKPASNALNRSISHKPTKSPDVRTAVSQPEPEPYPPPLIPLQPASDILNHSVSQRLNIGVLKRGYISVSF